MTGRIRMPRPLVRLHRDERGLVIGFFVKMVLVMLLLGLAIEEGGQLVVAQVKAQSAAREAAQAAADMFVSTHDAVKAKRAAKEAATAKDGSAKVINVILTTDGTATVTVREVAHTLVVKRVSFLRGFGEQQASETERHS